MNTPETEPVSGRTLKEHWEIGRVFRIQNDKFGTHDVLCVKSPGEGRDDRLRALPITVDGASRELLFISSVDRDIILKSWPNLRSYYADALAKGARSVKTIIVAPVG